MYRKQNKHKQRNEAHFSPLGTDLVPRSQSRWLHGLLVCLAHRWDGFKPWYLQLKKDQAGGDMESFY